MNNSEKTISDPRTVINRSNIRTGATSKDSSQISRVTTLSFTEAATATPSQKVSSSLEEEQQSYTSKDTKK